MKEKKTFSVLFMAQAAMIAAIYVVVTLVFAPFSYGEVQVRLSEALTILPVFTPAAIPGLFIGCLISNILGGCIIPDIIFGSLATLLGAIFTYMLRKQNKFLCAAAADRIQYTDRTVRTSLWIPGAAADPIYDADRRNRRSQFPAVYSA